MQIRHGDLTNCGEAKELAVVIDVLRAFTTAAFALDQGAEMIYCVEQIDRALALKAAHPDWLVMGENAGFSIPGFDFNNSPAAICKVDLSGRTLIQRTTAGTKGLVRSCNARELIACSLLTAGATAAYIQKTQPSEVFLVETGITPEGHGSEDTACADYVESLLNGAPIPHETLIQRVRGSKNGLFFQRDASADNPSTDLEYACKIDHFNWIMVGSRIDNQNICLTKKEISL